MKLYNNEYLEAFMNARHSVVHKLEYSSWRNMKTRCSKVRYNKTTNYYDKGITVCDTWLNSFENFYADMGDRPVGTTLDRLDNLKGYSKANCRWATSVQQNNNRSYKPSHSGIPGVSFNKASKLWQVYIRTSGVTTQLGYFADFFEACCTILSKRANT